MRVAVVLAILVMAMTAGCTGSGTPEPEVTAATATPEPSATTIPTAAPAPTVAPDVEATMQGDHVALPADGTDPTAGSDIEATVQARVSADLTRVAPTPAPAKTDRPDARASDQAPDGICYRTPELQKVILGILDVDLCQVVNEKELFRIRNLGNVGMPSVKEGDFAGFVNVHSMTLGTGEIEANGLRGLDGLREMHLVIQPEQELRTESFMGLESVEELKIELRPESLPQAGLPELPELPNLKYLTIRGMNAEESDPRPFRNLKNLETLNLRIVFGEDDAETPAEPYLIPASLLEGIGNLKEVSIEARVRPNGHEVQLPEEIFKENPALERVEIAYPRTFIERHTFSQLHDLKELHVLNRTHWTPVRPPELVISRDSPLYQSIRSGETIPGLYRLAEAAGD